MQLHWKKITGESRWGGREFTREIDGGKKANSGIAKKESPLDDTKKNVCMNHDGLRPRSTRKRGTVAIGKKEGGLYKV